MADYGKLVVPVYGNTKPLEEQVKKSAETAGTSAGESISRHMGGGLSKVKPVASAVGKSLVAGLGLATTAAVAFGVKAYQAAEASNKVTAQTAAVIKSTGGAAHVTAENVKQYAAALMAQDGVSGKAVRTGENMLLTFRNVRNESGKGNDIFKQATSVLTDMTAALHGGSVTAESMRASGIGLGKALNDPIAGVSALSRVGVTFTDQQKAQIKTLVESGHRLQAQKIILGELNKEFKGSAAATQSWTDRLKVAYGAIQSTIGQTLVKALDPLLEKIGKLATSFAAAAGPGGKLAPIMAAIGGVISRLVGPLGHVIELFTEWINKLSPQKVQQIVGWITKLGPALAAAGAAAAVFTGAGLGQNLPVIGGLIKNLMGPLNMLKGGLMGLPLPLKIVFGAFALLMSVSPEFRKAVTQLVTVLIRGLAPTFVQLGKTALLLVPIVVELAKVLGPVLADALNALMPLVTAFVDVIKFLTPIIKPLTFAVLAWVAAQWLLNAALDANPIGLVVIGLVALFVVLDLVWKHTVGFRKAIVEAFGTVFNWIKSHWPLLLAIIAGPIGLAVGLVIKHWDTVKRVTTATWNWLKGFVGGIIRDVQRAVSTGVGVIRSAISSAWNWIVRQTTTVWNAWGNIVRGAVRAVLGFLSNAWNVLRNAVTAVWRWLLSYSQSVWRGWGIIIRGAVGAVVGIVTNGFNTVRNVITNALSRATGAIRSWASSLLSLGKSAVTNLLNGISSAVSNIGSWIKAHLVDPIINSVKHWFGISSPSTVMRNLGESVTEGFVSGIVKQNPLTIAKKVFGSIPNALGGLLKKGLVDIGSLPGKALSALGKLGGWAGGLLTKIPGLSGLFGGGGGGGTGAYAGIMRAVLAHFGIPQLFSTFMAQMMTESGGNPKAINLWDSNAKAGIPSQGLMQVIPPTFAAYAGPYRSRGILDPLANIYAAVAYAVSRYGSSIAAVLGHGHGYAQGGILNEPVYGIGLHSRTPYSFGENAPRVPEMWSPLHSGRSVPGAMKATVINVYPQKGQSEVEIAAAVSRQLDWAAATGRA